MFDENTHLIVRFRQGDRGLVGKVVHYNPTWLSINSHKFVVVDRNYRGTMPRPGEDWVCRFIRDTNPTERRGVLVVSPVQVADPTPKFCLEELQVGAFRVPIIRVYRLVGLVTDRLDFRLAAVEMERKLNYHGLEFPADLLEKAARIQEEAKQQLLKLTADVDVTRPPYRASGDGWSVFLDYRDGLVVRREITGESLGLCEVLIPGPPAVRCEADLEILDKLTGFFGTPPKAEITRYSRGEYAHGYFVYPGVRVPFTQEPWNPAEGELSAYGVPAVYIGGGFVLNLGVMDDFDY